jgi:hypothetical protein
MQEQLINNKRDTQPVTKGAATPTVNKVIKGYIIFMALMNLVATVMLFNTYRDLSTHADPNLPHWPFLVLSLMGLGALAALYGLWRNQRWGFMLYLGLNIIAGLLTFFVLNTAPSVMSFVGLAVFLGVFAPRFKTLR